MIPVSLSYIFQYYLSLAHFLQPIAVVVELLSCVQLFCELMDCSPLDSSVYGILLARILEWVAISFSRGSSQRRDQTYISSIGRWLIYH